VRHFYFDHNATTPVAPELLTVFVPALTEDFGNASSIHYYGQEARARLDDARRQTATLLGADPREIVFTSGGTEADNLALFGTLRRVSGPRHLITTAIEHPAVLNACAQLEREGVEVTYLAPSPQGLIDPGQVRRALRPSTCVISVMHVNNELGTVQPLAEIGAIAREAGVPFHSDGVQAAGRLPASVRDLGVDLYSMSAHKMYAPKGAGALYVRKGVELAPVQYGGRHEGQRRAGTENVPGCVALGWACEHPSIDDMPRLAVLRDHLEAAVLDRLPGVAVNGAGAPRAANTTNLRFDGIGGEAMVIALDLRGFAVSSGSACSSGAVEPSHVLLAIGLTPEQARASVRISLGRTNTAEQVDALVEAIVDSVVHLRRLSPSAVSHV
jgi:cysteine desulfurase